MTLFNGFSEKQMNLPLKLEMKNGRILVFALALLLLSMQTATAQKQEPPVSREPLKVTLPKAKETTLKNGLRVMVLEGYDQVPVFTMQMVILSGGLSDPTDHRGLSDFTASLLREGTKTRTSREIAEQVESLGSTLGANSDLSSFTTTVTASGLVQNFDQALDIFADVIRNPIFPADELEKFKTRTIAQLQLRRSNPNFLAQERFASAIYGEHPAGIISPPADALKKTTSADLARFHAANFFPNNAILAVTGQVTLKEILPKIELEFGNWKPGRVPKSAIRDIPASPGSKIYLIDRPGSVQTVLQLGNLGIDRTDPDYFALLVMNNIIGGGLESRLFKNLREDKGYTYGAYSQFNGSRFRGTWAATSEVRTEVTDASMKEFFYELKRIRDELVPPAELEDAKRGLVGSFALSLEQPQGLLLNIVAQKLYSLPADYWDTYPKKVAAITAADVQRVARKYIDLEHLQIVAVGDAAKIRGVLEKYGTVEAFDSEGKSVRESADPK